MNIYRFQFSRLLDVERAIRSGQYPNCTILARKLEVSTKTIQRDIEYLKASRSAPIEYDFGRRGYYLTDPSWQMPGVTLTEGELLQLLFARQMAAHFRGTPLGGTLDALFEKLMQGLPDNVSVDPAIFSTQFSFHGRPHRPVLEKVWTDLFRAIRDCRVVEVSYRKVPGEKPELRILEPVHLSCIWDEWYLVAFCRARGDFRNFAVSRIVRIKAKKEQFDARDFEPEAYYRNRFQQIVGKPGHAYEVRVRFTPREAPWVLERKWHPKQRVQKQPDGGAILSFPAPNIAEVKRWVLQWGSEAEVLGPAELRAEVQKELEEGRKVYGKGYG